MLTTADRKAAWCATVHWAVRAAAERSRLMGPMAAGACASGAHAPLHCETCASGCLAKCGCWSATLAHRQRVTASATSFLTTAGGSSVRSKMRPRSVTKTVAPRTVHLSLCAEATAAAAGP